MVTATTVVSMGEGLSSSLSFMSSHSNPLGLLSSSFPGSISSGSTVWSDPGSGQSLSIGDLLIVSGF